MEQFTQFKFIFSCQKVIPFHSTVNIEAQFFNDTTRLRYIGKCMVIYILTIMIL